MIFLFFWKDNFTIEILKTSRGDFTRLSLVKKVQCGGQTSTVLNELDTDDVAETYQVTGNKNVFMGQNHPITTLAKAEALANAAEQVDDLFATKAVLWKNSTNWQ